jgi:hypothetical protein
MTKKRLLWWAAASGVLTASLSIWLVRGTPVGGMPRMAGAPPAASAGDPRLRRVLELLRKKDDPATWNELIALYASSSGDPGALTVRASVLNAAFNEPALGLRLKRVLEIIDADPSPPAEDPLWPELVQRLAEQWSDDVLAKGRDLMLMEQRERPRRALIDSFVELALSERAAELPSQESQATLSDLIDIYGQAPLEQQPRIQEAVRKLGGNDPAELLAGRGLHGDEKLELQAEYERNLQAGIDTLTKGQPNLER